MATTDSISNNNINNLFSGHSQQVEEKKDPLGRDAFLTMLVAQLQHQDPLNPMEGTDFTAQLAQFSSLEQQFSTNDNLEAILNSLDAKKEDNLIAYIGKEVDGTADTMVLSGGEPSGGQFILDKAAEVTISIYNRDGQEVRTIYSGQKGAGTHDVPWDGEDNSGEPLDDGNYVYEVFALDVNGGFVPVKTSVTGQVTGVSYQNGVPYLQVGDRLLDPATITRVRLPQAVEDAETGADAG